MLSRTWPRKLIVISRLWSLLFENLLGLILLVLYIWLENLILSRFSGITTHRTQSYSPCSGLLSLLLCNGFFSDINRLVNYNVDFRIIAVEVLSYLRSYISQIPQQTSLIERWWFIVSRSPFTNSCSNYRTFSLFQISFYSYIARSLIHITRIILPKTLFSPSILDILGFLKHFLIGWSVIVVVHFHHFIVTHLGDWRIVELLDSYLARFWSWFSNLNIHLKS